MTSLCHALCYIYTSVATPDGHRPGFGEIEMLLRSMPQFNDVVSLSSIYLSVYLSLSLSLSLSLCVCVCVCVCVCALLCISSFLSIASFSSFILSHPSPSFFIPRPSLSWKEAPISLHPVQSLASVSTTMSDPLLRWKIPVTWYVLGEEKPS